MLNDPSKVSREFWTSQESYPAYDHTYARRREDVQYLLPLVKDAGQVVDIGAGDGIISIILNELTTIRQFHLYDISQKLLDGVIARWGQIGEPTFHVGDAFGSRKPFAKGDWTICLGLLCYCFDDRLLVRFLRHIRSPDIIMRVPCAGYQRLLINKRSHNLGGQYAVLYRTVGEYHKIFAPHFEIKSFQRSWPNVIESRFEHRQYTFHLKPYFSTC